MSLTLFYVTLGLGFMAVCFRGRVHINVQDYTLNKRLYNFYGHNCTPATLRTHQLSVACTTVSDLYV